jgi:hypothetical protein
MPATSLFTYDSLATLSGAALATALLVQVAQYIPWLRRLPKEVTAWVAAVVVLGIAMAAQGQLKPAGIPLVLLNGLLVAATATGAQQAVTSRLNGRRADRQAQ